MVVVETLRWARCSPLRARPAALYGPFPYQMGGLQLKGVELNIPKRIGKRKQWYKVGLDVEEGDLKPSSSLLANTATLEEHEMWPHVRQVVTFERYILLIVLNSYEKSIL